MNTLAKILKMERTHFMNPHGIDTTERSLPYSTASDMARLTRYAVNKAGLSLLRFAKGTADFLQPRRQETWLHAAEHK